MGRLHLVQCYVLQPAEIVILSFLTWPQQSAFLAKIFLRKKDEISDAFYQGLGGGGSATG